MTDHDQPPSIPLTPEISQLPPLSEDIGWPSTAFDAVLTMLDAYVDAFPPLQSDNGEPLGGLPEPVAEALRAGSIELFTVGLPGIDGAIARLAIARRATALNEYATMRGHLYSPTGAVALRATRRPTARELRTRSAELEHATTHGLMSLPGVNCVLGPTQLLYRKEVEPLWGDDYLLESGLGTADKRLLYGDIDPGTLTSAELSTDLRNHKSPDLSKELLDDRFDTFLNLLQPPLSTAILNSLYEYAWMSNQYATAAEDMARAYRDIIFSGSVLEKQVILGELQAHLRAEGERTQVPGRKRLLMATSNYLGVILAELRDFSDFYRAVYAHFDYDEPSYFAERDALDDARTAQSVAQPAGNVALDAVLESPPGHDELDPAVTDEEDLESAASESDADEPDADESKPDALAPPPPPPPEIVEDILKQRSALQARIEDHAKEWHLSRNNLKGLGLEALNVFLTRGGTIKPPRDDPRYLPKKENPASEWTLPATGHSMMLLGTIVRLDDIVRKGGKDDGTETARVLLSDAAACRQELVDTQHRLRTYAGKSNYRGFTGFAIPDVEGYLQHIADHWHIFEQLFALLGPANRPNFTYHVRSMLPPPGPHSLYRQVEPHRVWPADFVLDRRG